MPILAGYPVAVTPPIQDPFSDFIETRTLAFRNLDGTDIMPFTGREFIGMDGMEGVDYPPVESDEDQVPGQHGSRVLYMRYASRDITIPMWLRSDSGHRAYLNNRSRLMSLFDFDDIDYQSLGGTFDLVANSLDGNNERSLRVRYSGGMEGLLTHQAERSAWSMLGLKLRAVRPFWSGQDWTTPTIRKSRGVSYFSRFPGRLSNSRALGSDITVNVPGTARSWPQVNIIGPSSAVEISGPNFYVSIPGGVDADEVVTVETDPDLRAEGTVFNGDPDWSRIAAECVFGNGLKPGPNVFRIDVGTATSDTVAWVAGTSQWKTPW